jgi:hypothetical protein
VFLKPPSTKFNVGSTYADSEMTKTKKRLLLIASLPLVIVVVLGVLAMLPPRPGVTKANFDRIQEGMTMMEVEEIFGREGNQASRGRTVFWGADDGSGAAIGFGMSHDCVVGKHWHDSNETFLDKIRRWLHLR